ncbi:MAG: BatD family protein, partial [Bacteroidota bacterium]
MKKYLIFGILFSILFVKLEAQEVQFVGSANSVVETGEQFRLTYTLNTEGSNFIGPAIQNFSMLAGPSQSSSSSVQYINGRVMQSSTISFTFILQAIQPGTYTLSGASVVVNGKKIQSNPVTIKVVKGNSSSPQGNSNNTPEAGANLDGNDLFLKAVPSKSNPLQGEQITVTYKLYTRVPVSLNGIDKIPSYEGFWSQDLIKDKDKYAQYNETINGQKYMVAEIRKVALFPQKGGKLLIDPLQIDIVAQLQTKKKRNSFNDPFFDNFFNDSFFGSSVQNVKKTLRSNSVTVNVKPLPAQVRPADFSGAVGSFELKPSIDRKELKANEALTLRLNISGKGNLNLIEKPNVVFPPDFEAYDPKIIDNISYTANGVSGSRTFEYLVIPRNPGEFIIKPASFSYFDLAKNTYVRLQSPQYTIKVQKGDGSEANITISSANQEDIKYLGQDIRFIRSAPFELTPVGKYFFGSDLYYLLLVLPALLFAVMIFVWKNQIKKRSDIAFMRNKKATRIATSRLKKANTYLKEAKQEAFYNEI